MVHKLSFVSHDAIMAFLLGGQTGPPAQRKGKLMEFVGTFWSLVPALVAIILALITKETYSSLFIGIVVGALLVANLQPIETLDHIINDAMVPAIQDTAGIFIFLVILGAMVALIAKSGASAAFGRWAVEHVHTRAGSLIATFLFSMLIFIDDYFACLTVGTTMMPITDRKRVSRAKMAFVIDATAAPLCAIAPVSSWAAAASSYASDMGVNGIALFIQAIPFNFYTLMMLVFIVTLTVMGFDYGPMAKAELEAIRDGKLGAKKELETPADAKGKVIDMVLPIIVLIVVCIIAMVYVGGFFGTDAWGGTDNAGDFIGAFGNTDAFIALPWGSLIAIVLTMIWMWCRRIVGFKEAMETLTSGFNAMVPAMLILFFACSLKNMTNMLEAGAFVESVMTGAAAGLYALLPAIIFLVAIFIAFSTGTSWGTFGILIPIVLPVLAADPTLQVIGISACFAGAVCGDHCSPISDTTIMASAGTDMDHIEHVQTQLPYALTVAAMSFVMFVIAGFVRNWVVMIPIWLVVTIAVCFILKKTVGKSWKDMEAEAAAKAVAAE